MQQETDQSQATKRLQNKQAKAKILEDGNYTPIPNKLRQACRDNIISKDCYDLICELLEHSESFAVRDEYLLKYVFSDRRYLKKATEEALSFNLASFKKVRQGRSFVKCWTVNSPHEWLIPTVQKFPVEGQDQQTNSLMEISHRENSLAEISLPLTRRTKNKKKLNKKNGGEKRARACAYDQTNELVKKEETPLPSQGFSSSHWVSEYQPSDVTDTLARHKVIPTKVSGEKIWVPDIKTWNKLVSEVWSSSTSSEIQADIVRLANWGGKLPKDRDQALALIFELRRLEDQNGSSESHDTVT